MKTRNGLPKYCSYNEDRHGTKRVLFRRRGFATYLPGIPWSEEFMRRYASALEGVKTQPTVVGSIRTIAGSFDALIVSYYRSPEFLGLKTSTQKVRRRIIERFRKEHGTKPVALLNRTHIKNIIGAKADTPEAANNLLKVLRVLLGFAVEQGMIESNPAIGVKHYKSQGDGIHTWTEGEVAQFESRHPDGSKARLALALYLYTAQRVSDVIRMGWQDVRDGKIDGAAGEDQHVAANPYASRANSGAGIHTQDQHDVHLERIWQTVLACWHVQLVRQAVS